LMNRAYIDPCAPSPTIPSLTLFAIPVISF
jgi:hypothetical protein